MICKFCKSEKVFKFKSFSSPYFSNKDFTLYICDNCSSQFFDINQHQISLNRLYEKLAKNKNDIPLDFSIKQYWEDQKKMIFGLIDKQPISIIDIGCRTGDFLMHFKKTIEREGVEISNYYSEIASKRGLKIYNSNFQNTHFEKKYDIVSAYNILEHIVNPIDFLKRVSSIVNKNGLFVILIPIFNCLKVKFLTKLNIKWHMYIPPEHLNFFSKRFLDSYLNHLGFKLVKRYYSSGGLINPFRRIPIINGVFSKFMFYYDKSLFNKLPIFDHLFSYYKKIL
ncbi:MAG: class I SAM-dependent methyltransferase [Promethearchaeota archaeon]